MIKETGEWSTPLFEKEMKWNINYSSILTKLIQYAGRYCESFASDLFIIWQYCVENKLSDPNLENYILTFGFKEMGVDHELSNDPERQPVTRNSKENSYYYRKIANLEITINGGKIEMLLR